MPRACSHCRRCCPAAARRGQTLWFVIGGLTLLAVLGASAGAFYNWRARGEGIQPLTYVVQRGSFAFDVTERGEIESSNNLEIRCEVKARNGGGTAIIEVVPEGRMVEEGELLVVLDSSALDQERVQQQITCNTSHAIMVQAQNDYDAAVISKTEYLEGAYRQEEQLVLNEIFVAEENLRRAEQYLLHSELLAARGYVTALQLEGDRFAVEKAEGELEAAQTKLHVLQNYTKEKRIKELESAIISSEAAWRAEENSYQLELDKLSDIEEQISHCRIFAPQAGQVVYANEFDRRGNGEIVIEPGTQVLERQVIIRLPDPEQMQVKASISESRIAYVHSGMPVDIRVDAFDNLELGGEVGKVNEYPEPSGWFSSSVKKYTAVVTIHNPPPTLRPGLTAQVKIHVEQLEDVLSVPTQAILERSGRYYCLVHEGEAWNPREVTIGPTNDKHVVIEQGLEKGEEIAINPRRYIDEDELPGGPPASARSQALDEDTSESMPPTGGPEQPGPGGPAGAAEDSPGPEPGSDAGAGGPVGGPPGGGQFDPGAIFSRMDADSDGSLSGDEIPAERREQMLSSDTNGNGAISREEFMAGMRALQQRVQQGGAGQPE